MEIGRWEEKEVRVFFPAPIMLKHLIPVEDVSLGNSGSHKLSLLKPWLSLPSSNASSSLCTFQPKCDNDSPLLLVFSASIYHVGSPNPDYNHIHCSKILLIWIFGGYFCFLPESWVFLYLKPIQISFFKNWKILPKVNRFAKHCFVYL